MRKKTAVAALSVLALAPALTACGSSAKSSSATSGAATATTSASAKATSTATSTAGKTGKANASTGANGCTPVSKKGNCYQPKEFCAKTQHGMKGIAADGKKIVCKQNNGQWVWELA